MEKIMDRMGNGKGGLKRSNGYFTAVEIESQPSLWQKIFENIVHNQSLAQFFQGLGLIEGYNIILTGAGSSAFIGDVLESAFKKYLSWYSSAIPTTSIVTHPQWYFSNERPTLMVSFARSGDSPESVASMNLANRFCDDIHHLVVTCNPNGKMIDELNPDKDHLLLLPDGSNDRGLAMTASFTGMLLAGYLVARLSELELLKPEIETLVEHGKEIIENHHQKFKELADLDFSRCVFLGSGALLGISRESHLKVQELTNGKIMCNYYSYLELRHGPKVVIDPETIVVFLISSDPYVQRYEHDLINDVVNESLGMRKIGISDHFKCPLDINFHLDLSSGNSVLDNYLYAIICTLPSQMLGFYKSLNLGCNPDAPSANGTISRVVKGFEIYDNNTTAQ